MQLRRYFNRAFRQRLIAGDEPDWLKRHPRRRYITAKYLSVLPWVDREAVEAIHRRAQELTERTGTKHVVDHVIPLNHPRVCGLTVPWNLRVVPDRSNLAKSNAWCEWHGELFVGPEQFTFRW